MTLTYEDLISAGDEAQLEELRTEHLALLNASRRDAAWWDTPGFGLVHQESDEPRRWFTMTTTILRHKGTGLLYGITWDRLNSSEGGGEHEYDEDAIPLHEERRAVTMIDYLSDNGSRYGTREVVTV